MSKENRRGGGEVQRTGEERKGKEDRSSGGRGRYRMGGR
jgi:hypothetical protein